MNDPKPASKTRRLARFRPSWPMLLIISILVPAVEPWLVFMFLTRR